MITIKNKEEMEQYYNVKTNTYEFMSGGDAIDVEFLFDVYVKSNIKARDINARDIKARRIKTRDIKAWDINVWNINARDINVWDINAGNIKARDINAVDIKARNINAGDISYYGVCFAYNNISYTSIKSRRRNARHFCLDGEITIKQKTYTITLEDKNIELSEESYNAFVAQFK